MLICFYLYALSIYATVLVLLNFTCYAQEQNLEYNCGEKILILIYAIYLCTIASLHGQLVVHVTDNLRTTVLLECINFYE